ncbi:MAG TPA: GTP cyclohydrolase I FolE [Candidatus Saccharimonadales bacterium]|nr:GTP cyclohydrolase I FolE [Candidatus Saccharimonadales bacterium]
MDKEATAILVQKLLTALGEDANREGLKKTPDRVVRAYEEILNGYGRTFENEVTVFTNTHKYDDIIYSGSIRFFSTCEHHLLPFFGTAHIAYIPSEQIIGLSKLSRVVDIYARRLQDQERITMQVASELEKHLKPKGTAVLLEAQHLCNMARGVKQFDSNMKTMTFTGIFKQKQELCDRFFRLIG